MPICLPSTEEALAKLAKKSFGSQEAIGQLGIGDVRIQRLEPSRLPVIEVILARHDHVAVHLAAGVEFDRPLVPVLILRKGLDHHLDAGQFLEIGHLRFDEGRKGVLVHQKTDLGPLGLLPVDRRESGRRHQPHAQQGRQRDKYPSSFHTMPPCQMFVVRHRYTMVRDVSLSKTWVLAIFRSTSRVCPTVSGRSGTSIRATREWAPQVR